jgi:hypothetical protein
MIGTCLHKMHFITSPRWKQTYQHMVRPYFGVGSSLCGTIIHYYDTSLWRMTALSSSNRGLLVKTAPNRQYILIVLDQIYTSPFYLDQTIKHHGNGIPDT